MHRPVSETPAGRGAARACKGRHLILSCAAMLALRAPAMASATAPDCAAHPGVALQVLGSGGPIADDDRAGSGYLLRHAGRARLLVDAGAGTFQRFGAADARLQDLDAVVLSHLHTDHAAAFPGLVKSLYFSDRTRPLAVVGPDGAGAFPSLARYLEALFGDGGAYAYLGGALDGTGGLARLEPLTVSHRTRERTPITLPAGVTGAEPPLSLAAVGVHHGIVPTLAWRVRLAGRIVVFASDQSAKNPHMPEFAKDADLMVIHAAIPEGAGAAARALHRTPSELAALVRAAAPAQVVVSHWMQRSLAVQERVLATIDAALPGRVVAATDLSCFALE